MANSGSILVGSSGCLLPFLIIFNFFFGRAIFNSTRMWLGVELILILIFVLKLNIMARKINQQFRQKNDGWTFASQGRKHKSKVIDVQGHVVDDDKRLR